MRQELMVLALAVTAAVGSLAWGQAVVAVPYARVFASASGRVGLKVLPNVKDPLQPATGILFTLGEDGSEKELWRRELVNLPGQVSVFEDGQQVYVVALDGWGSLGGKHGMVVYGGQGQVLRDLHSDELRAPAPPEAPRAAGPNAGVPLRSAVGTLQSWRAGATLHFVPGEGGAHVELRWPDGTAAAVPIAGGPVKRSTVASGRQPPQSSNTPKNSRK
jgi:hypothetical protein